MSMDYAHGQEFVRQVRPILERHDGEGLVAHLSRYWPNDRLRGLLTCGNEDAEKMALVCLSLTGTMADNAVVAQMLHDEDALTASFAEHAIWSIWFRAGDDDAKLRLTRAVHLIDKGLFAKAIEVLSALLERCPTFAEAYNQRAISYFLQGDYNRAIADCRAALRLNAHHFGAMAGLGHSYASLGQLAQALEAYRCSLQLHPRLEGIRESIQQIRKHVDQDKSQSHSPPSCPLPVAPAHTSERRKER